MYGKSTSNQRIEAWWSQLHKCNADWWIKYFKDLRDGSIYCDADMTHEQCLKFCYMKIVQDKLYGVVKHWNTHSIRPSLNMSGRPDTSYFLPEVNATYDYVTRVDDTDIEVPEELRCLQNPLNGCEPKFNELATMIMEENGLNMPTSFEEAELLYLELLHHIRNI